LKVPRQAFLSGLRLHPAGDRFVATVETSRLDIWILDGFSLGGRRLARLGF
jgi:hypothetical protein